VGDGDLGGDLGDGDLGGDLGDNCESISSFLFIYHL
tara:strand:+ start:972 stop:1079 length:108 start_codon:yes stop_codon:yes gene_type:complete